jgi:YHS domain-containing protein
MILRLLRFLLLLGIGYFIYKFFWKGETLGLFKSKKKRRHQSPKAIEEMKKDPVCGTYIPENQAIRFRRNNTIYYFCSEECKQKFQELKE